MSQFAWVTLATNDSYSLGALVLAYSLKRSGTKHQLAILITPTISQPMRDKLQTVFDLVQEVNVLDSKDAANLALLSRPELGVTFTKLYCWRLTQYEKCVFLDADILVLQNSDELFERDEFSAAPDVGWPDCFNSGVFVFKPNLDTFAKLIEFAAKKGSFDGGDQGLLNSFFADWAQKDISKHLPFTYNTCSTACYSYLPAFKQFGQNVKILHFIGQLKPWLINFDSSTKTAYTPQEYLHLAKFIQMWWDLFCTEVHPKLSGDMAGLAGALAQLTLGAPRTPELTAYEDNMRRQCWEAGNIDYLGIMSQTIRTTTEVHETTLYEVSGNQNTQMALKTRPTNETQTIELVSTEIDGKVISAKQGVTEQENQSKTVDVQQSSVTSKQTHEESKQVQERIVTEVTADGKTIQKIIKTYPGEVTEIIEETETTEIGDQKTVKHTVTEGETKTLPVDDKNNSLFPIDQPVVIVPGHQKVEFDPVTNSKIVTEKTTTGYQQTITTVTAEGKTITRVKTFFDPIEIPDETVEEETFEEEIVEPEETTETVTTTTTTIEPIVQEKKIDQSTKITQQNQSTKSVNVSSTTTTSTSEQTTSSTSTATNDVSTQQVDQTLNQKSTAIDQKNVKSVDKTAGNIKNQDSVTEITEVTETTEKTKSVKGLHNTNETLTVKNDQEIQSEDVKGKNTTALANIPTDDNRITQIVSGISKDTSIDATLTQTTSETSKVSTEVNKKTQEHEKKFEQNVEIVASAPTSTTIIKEQVQKEQRKQTTVSTSGQVNVQQKGKTEQVEVQEEYEEVQSSQVTVSGKTKKDDESKALPQPQMKAIVSKDTVDKTTKAVKQQQQHQTATEKNQKSQVAVTKKTNESTVQESVNKKAATTAVKKTDNPTVTVKEKQTITKDTGENKTIVTTSKNGDITTEEIRHFAGGREHTYKTVCADGTTKTASKTFYDPVPVDPNTNKMITPKGTAPGKNEVKTTTADNGDVTTEEIRYIPGGREHIYHTVCTDGTTKSASKTFYDSVPVETQEHTEEIEEYEETITEESTTATSSTQSTKKMEDIKSSATSIHSTGSTDSAKKKLPSAPASKQAASKEKGASATPVPPPRKKEVKNPTKGK